MFDSRIRRFIQVLKELRLVIPPLKKLLFDMVWFLFAVVEIVRFVRSLV